jgi:hypothetical protein
VDRDRKRLGTKARDAVKNSFWGTTTEEDEDLPDDPPNTDPDPKKPRVGKAFDATLQNIKRWGRHVGH